MWEGGFLLTARGGARFTSVASDLVGPRIAHRWREAERVPDPAVEPDVREVLLRF